MGIIRLTLALIVVFSHSGYPIQTIGGLASVEAFFILSGVYMAAVWKTKYSTILNGTGIFYANRALRLWPIYFFVLIATFIAYIVIDSPTNSIFNFFHVLQAQGLNLETTLISISVLFFIFQDFISVNETLHFLLPVRQSWSVASELLFYLSVPILFRKPSIKFLVSGFIGLLTLKYLLLEYAGWRTSYFIPIGNYNYFLLGGALYLLITNPKILLFKERFFSVKYYYIVNILTIGMLLSFGDASLETGGIVRHSLFIFLFSIAIIILFQRSINKVDLFLGDISYGVYLNHFLVLVIGIGIGLDGLSNFLFTVTFSLLLSILSEKLIQRPINHLRLGIIRNKN